ncbi:MAG: NAD(P)H-dependent oxidoreductase subunit E [Fimbriimonadaceae bacterium]|nr:NAD(P)H-dependent oxidoreductase subunit E [Fimbriimonadaceae bacterium]QYK57045.1 MAG: NAD(P)H-dependent oxidoreductase subunit E [Fimbriimonadaceae bacterium]
MSELIQIGATRPKAPRPEDLTLKWSEKAVRELEGLKGHYPDLKSCILPALWISQREYGGHLPPEAIAEVAVRLERSYAEIEGVATFYSMYNTAHRPGLHMIEVCTCLSCHMCGAYRLADMLEEILGVPMGGTTPDGAITLHEVECLDACDRAPVVQVGDAYLDPGATMQDADGEAKMRAWAEQLVESLRANPDSTVVQLADSIVQAQLRASDI